MCSLNTASQGDRQPFDLRARTPSHLVSLWRWCLTRVVAAQLTFIACAMLLVILSLSYLLTRAKPVYLLDYAVYQAPD